MYKSYSGVQILDAGFVNSNCEFLLENQLLKCVHVQFDLQDYAQGYHTISAVLEIRKSAIGQFPTNFSISPTKLHFGQPNFPWDSSQ